jgi:GGDEF domain-containing protein
LRATAQRLLRAVGAGGVAGRLGGDEFVVLVFGAASSSDISEMVERVRQELTTESPWFRWRLGLLDFDQGLVGPFRSVEDGFELCGR